MITLPMALLGSFLGALVGLASKAWETGSWLSKHKCLAYLIIGIGVGYCWWALGMPNNFNVFLAGFFGPEVLDHLLGGYRKRLLGQ